jgi:RND family efflux transporter MFP subunit
MFQRPYLFVALVLASSALVACSSKPLSDPRTEAPLVRLSTAEPAPGMSRTFTGVVGARVQSDLSFRVSGKIVARLVDAGQVVKRGQPLMRLDPIDLALTARSQQELVDAAQARAKQTADDEIRYRDLVAAGAVSASTYEQIKAAADSARAQLTALQAQADVAHDASSYTELLADADGVVVDTVAEPGQVVSPGQVVIRLAHAGPREAVVQFPETLRPRLGSMAHVSLYGDADDAVPATLRQLSDAADPLTRTYEARYVLQGAMANAPLGATLTLSLPSDDTSFESALEIPIGALFDPGTGTGVWTVGGTPARASWHKVKVLALTDDTADVSGDIHPGDQVIALGAQLIQAGETVRTNAHDTNGTLAETQGALR